MSEYICFRMAIKNTPPCGNFNPVLSLGKFTQQQIVDYYCLIKGDRLKYIRSRQSKWVDTYSGLADPLQVRADNTNVSVGKLGVLPSSFIGSPRNIL